MASLILPTPAMFSFAYSTCLRTRHRLMTTAYCVANGQTQQTLTRRTFELCRIEVATPYLAHARP